MGHFRKLVVPPTGIRPVEGRLSRFGSFMYNPEHAFWASLRSSIRQSVDVRCE